MSNPGRPLRVLCFTALAFFAVTSRAHATLIPIGIGAFSGSAHVADFTVPTTQPLPYSEEGAMFASFSGFASNVISGANFLFMAGSGTLRVNFSDPEIRAGFFFFNSSPGPAAFSVEAFSDLLGTQSLGQLMLASFGAGQSGFVGFQADALFLRADISFGVSGPTASFFIDDFRFEPGVTAVPEPSTIALTLVGAGWLARRRHGRRR